MGRTSAGVDPTPASTKEGNNMGNEQSKAGSSAQNTSSDLAESLGKESESWRQSFYANQPSEIRCTRSPGGDCSTSTLDDDDFWKSDTPEEGSSNRKDVKKKGRKDIQPESRREKHQARSEAISLIRSRTRSRSSASEIYNQNTPPGLTPDLSPVSDAEPRHTMVYGTASVLDYAAATRKKKKKTKNKGAAEDADVKDEHYTGSCSKEVEGNSEVSSVPKDEGSKSCSDVQTSPPAAEIDSANLDEFPPIQSCVSKEKKSKRQHAPAFEIFEDNENQTKGKENAKDATAQKHRKDAGESATSPSKNKSKKGKGRAPGLDRAAKARIGKDVGLYSRPLAIRPKSSSRKEAPAAPKAPQSDEGKGSKCNSAAISKGREKADTAAGGIPNTPTRQRSRRNTVSTKDKLPAIREASHEVHKAQPSEEIPISPIEKGNAASETQSVVASTPKSTDTVSTGWGTATTALTPQTTGVSEPSTKGTSHRCSKKPPAKAAPTTTTATTTVTALSSKLTTATTHAHPASSTTRTQAPKPTHGHGSVTTQKPEGFFWQLDSHGFPCGKADCDKRCNLWDGAAVICPRCGPFSELRYCSKEHLLEDIKNHWANCGSFVFCHPCCKSTIPCDVRESCPLVPCMHGYDTPERHRQAVHFNMNAHKGDYFIFSDWQDMVEAGFPDDNLAIRCSNKVVHTIHFDDEKEKDRFRRVLAACLLMTLDGHELIDYLFRLIRDQLRAQNTAPELETALKYQFHQEFAVTIQDHITGNRHACETDWDGRNRRNCPDDLCRAEYRRLLGSLGGRGHVQLLEYLESSFWILRMVRTTHPEVKDAVARMRGEGFDGVAEDDQRVFRRGDGWDGPNTGEMEIEGDNA